MKLYQEVLLQNTDGCRWISHVLQLEDQFFESNLSK